MVIEFKHPVELYRLIATECGGLTLPNDILTVTYGTGKDVVSEPLPLGERSIHLPTQEFLKNPDWEHFAAFHPLAESPMRGESEILRVLRRQIVVNLNTTLAALLESLVRIAADTDGHSKLSAAASECLDSMPKADQASLKAMLKVLKQLDHDSVDAMGDVIDAIGSAGRRKLINFYLKRPGQYKGKQYGRVCVVEFPFLSAEASDHDNTIFGVKLRQKDYVGFRKLFQFIVDTEEANGETYNSGTDSSNAPYLRVLLDSWFKVAERLNRVIKLYKSTDPTLTDYLADVSWKKAAADFGPLMGLLPAFDYNVGVNEKGLQTANGSPTPTGRPRPNLAAALAVKEEPVIEAPAPVETPMAPQQPVYQQPQQSAPAPTTAPTTQSGGVNFMEMLKRQQQQQQPVYQQPQYPQQPVYPQQQPMYQQPQQPYYAPPVQQPVYRNDPPVQYAPQPQQPVGWAQSSLLQPAQQQVVTQPMYQQPQQPGYYQNPMQSPAQFGMQGQYRI